VEETGTLACLVPAPGWLKALAGRGAAEVQALAGWQRPQVFLQGEKELTEGRQQLENPVRV